MPGWRDSMANPFPLNDSANWPPIPDDLVTALQEWGTQPSHSASWTPGMSGYDAIGNLAFIAGMDHIVRKVAAVRRAQLDRAAKDNIATSLKGT